MEWQLVQAISFWVCSERRMLALSKLFSWHVRQASIACFGGSKEKARGMVVLPPRAAMWACPGPWQPSHPVRSGGSLPEATLL